MNENAPKNCLPDKNDDTSLKFNTQIEILTAQSNLLNADLKYTLGPRPYIFNNISAINILRKTYSEISVK